MNSALYGDSTDILPAYANVLYEDFTLFIITPECLLVKSERQEYFM